MATGRGPFRVPYPPTADDHLTRKDYVDQRAVPPGGTAGQVLTKQSALDRDVVWATPTGGSGGGGTATIRGALDYDDSQAPTDGQAIVWSGSGGKYRPFTLTPAMVGADPSGTAAAQRSAHEGSPDPHSQYLTNARGDARYAALSHSHAAGDITSGVLDIARLPVGTTASTVAAGNDSRFTDARTPTAHKSTHATGGSDALVPADIGAVPTSRAITAGTGLTGGGALSADRTFAVAYGTAAGTAVQGNDTRVTADQAATTASIRTLGTGALQAVAGNDSRLSDARTPTAHATSHSNGGSDPLRQIDIRGNTAHALTAYQTGTSGSISAVNVVSDNPAMSAAQISGTETSTGTLKITHRGYADGSDASAAALSLDIKQAGTAAQGLFLTATDGPTTGNLVTVRNNSREDLVLKASGRMGLGLAIGATPAALLDLQPADATTSGQSIRAFASGANMSEWRRSSDGAVRTRISNSAQLVTQEIAYFAGSGVQVGSTSTDFGGGSGVLSVKDATTVPSTNPTGGSILYSESGRLKFRMPDSTVVDIADRVPTARTLSTGTGLSGGGDLSANRSLSVLYGAVAGTAAQGNDARLSDARTPLTHAASHAAAGSDPLTPVAIGAIRALTPTGIKTGSYTAQPGERVVVDASGGNVTITAPPCATGVVWGVQRVDNVGANLVTVQVNNTSTETIGALGATGFPIRLQDQSQAYQGNGTNWLVERSHLSLSALDARFSALVHQHSAADLTSGTLDIARVPVGTTGTTVAAGNDSRLLAVASKAEDSAVVHLAGAETIGGVKTIPAGSANSWIFNQPPQVAVGTSANHAVRRDDARLTDARTPTAHAASHATGGSDAITALVPTGGSAGQILTKTGSADHSMAWANAGGGGLGGVVDCSAMTTAAAINAASAAAAPGSIIWLGRRPPTAPLVIEDTIILRPYQKLLGAGGRAELTCVQAGASFTAGKPLLAAQGYLNNTNAADNPISVVGVHIDVNVKAGSHGMVVFNFWSHFEDVQVERCDGAAAHGIHATDASANNTKSQNSHSENTFKRCRFMSFTNRASMFWAECTNGLNNSNQDGHLQDCFFAGTVTPNVGAQGGYGIRITRAAGWTIDNNHLYGIGYDAISLDNCYATKVTHNYVEDFGGQNAASPGDPTYGYYNGICLGTVLDGRPSVVMGNKVSITPPDTGTWTGNRWTAFYARAGASQTKAYLTMTGNSAVYTQGSPPATLKNWAYCFGEASDADGRNLHVEWGANQIGMPQSTWWQQQRIVAPNSVNLSEIPQTGARSHGGSWETDIFGDLMSNGARDDATAGLAMSSTIRTMVLLVGWLPAGRYTGFRMFRTVAMSGGACNAALFGSTNRTATSWAQIGGTVSPTLSATGLLEQAVTNFVLDRPQFVILEIVLGTAPSTYPTFSATPAVAAGLINPSTAAFVSAYSAGTSLASPLNPTSGFTQLNQKPWVAIY